MSSLYWGGGGTDNTAVEIVMFQKAVCWSLSLCSRHLVATRAKQLNLIGRTCQMLVMNQLHTSLKCGKSRPHSLPTTGAGVTQSYNLI